jgi:hypothetical protein
MLRFYGPALAPLGIDLCSRDQAGAGFNIEAVCTE